MTDLAVVCVTAILSYTFRSVFFRWADHEDRTRAAQEKRKPLMKQLEEEGR